MNLDFEYGYHNCPVCGKRFYVSDAGMWRFQRNQYAKGKTYKLAYFCGWNCYHKDQLSRKQHRSLKAEA